MVIANHMKIFSFSPRNSTKIPCDMWQSASAAGGTPTLPEAALCLKKEGEPLAPIAGKEKEYILQIAIRCMWRFCPCVQRCYGRTFKGCVDVRSKGVWTYVQRVLGRTCKGALNDAEWKVNRTEWNMGKMNGWWTWMNGLACDWRCIYMDWLLYPTCGQMEFCRKYFTQRVSHGRDAHAPSGCAMIHCIIRDSTCPLN